MNDATATTAPYQCVPEVCPWCKPDPLAPQIRDALGHDRVGHWASHCLIEHGYRTLAELSAAPDGELLDVRNLGTASLERVRSLAPYRPEPPFSGDDPAALRAAVGEQLWGFLLAADATDPAALRTLSEHMLRKRLSAVMAAERAHAGDRVYRILHGGPPDVAPVPCAKCQYYARAGELTAALGHDWLGHTAANLMFREGYTTLAQLSALPDQALLKVRMFGTSHLARVRSVAPYIPEPEGAAVWLLG